MSLKNQKMIAAKIKSIDPNFVPSIEVDSRTTPRTDDELNFMANMVIAINGYENIVKVFFDRRVKNCWLSQIHVGYSGDGFELILNMHRLRLDVEFIKAKVAKDVAHLIRHRDGLNNIEVALAQRDAFLAQRDAFDAAVNAACAHIDYDEEIKDQKMVDVDRNFEVVINGVQKTFNYSTKGFPTVKFKMDRDFDADGNAVSKILRAIGEDAVFPIEFDGHGEAWFVYEEDLNEEVTAEDEVENEMTAVEKTVEEENEMTAVEKTVEKEVEAEMNVTETEDELDRAIAEFNASIEAAENESVNEIVDHFTSAFIERIKKSDHFIEKVDFQKAATVVGKQCREYAPYLHFADDAVREMLVAKVKYDHKFSEASKFESFDDHNVRQVGAYGVCYIDREGDSCYGVPERFKPKSDAAFYAEAKYEKLFKSVFDDGVRFEFVGVEPSSHMVKIGEKFFVEHRALMCSFMTDEEILAKKPNGESLDDESYIEMIREGESDRTDRYVVMIRKIHF